MSTKTELYDQDFYAWVQAQAALLKARQFDALDLDNLIEEVESIARQERHLLWHRFRTLLERAQRPHDDKVTYHRLSEI